MLKHLYKTLVISLISGSLLSVQTSTAFAAVTESKGVTTTDTSGNITNKKSYTFEKISDADMLASLGMLAGGFITGRMLVSYKPMTPDVLVAGVAGSAFVAGEILSNLKFKGTIDEMTEEVVKESAATINEEQIQRLQDLKKSYEEAKKTTKTKKVLQLASAAAFGAASATAGYIAYTEFTAMRACDSALASGLASVNTCVEADTPTTAGLREVCRSCAKQLIDMQKQMKVIEGKRISPGLSKNEATTIMPLEVKAKASAVSACKADFTASAEAAGAAVTTACGTALKIASLNQIFSYNPIKISSNKILNDILYANHKPKIDYEVLQSVNYTNSHFIEKAFDLFFPKAQASWLPLLGLGASTAAAFTLMSGSTAVEVDMMMFVPFNRAIAFGALAGVAFLASKSSDSVIGKLDENIKKIDAILDELNKLAKGVKTQNIKIQAVAIKTVTTPPIIPLTTNDQTTTTCLNSEKSSNCTSLQNDLISSTGFATLPNSLQSLATQVATVGDGLSGKSGISSSTLSAAESLGNKQAAIGKLVKTREAAYEKLADGQVNFAKERDKFLTGISEKIKKDLQQKGMTATGMMASLGAAPIDTNAAKAALLKEEHLKPKMPASANAIDIAATGKDESLKLDFKEQAPATNYAMGSTASGSSPEYDIKGNDISGEQGPSIFEVISNRYLKSGYPKLLEVEPSKN